MATASATPAKPKAVMEIERLGFGYEEVAQYDLTQITADMTGIDEDFRVQVREASHYAPKESAERYAIQMNHSEFPPIIMTRDGALVDGNTRVAACMLRKQRFFPALVLDVDYVSGSAKRRAEVAALAATLNSQNGVPLTGREAREAVRKILPLGWLNEQIGRAIGVKPSVVTAVRKQVDAEDKLTRVGLPTNDGLSGAPLRALGAKEVLALNDVPFKTVAELARDADLNAREITGIAKEAHATGSDQAAMAKLAEIRNEMRDRIQQKQLTGHGVPPASASLRRFLGNVLKYEGNPQELIETDPEQNAKHIEFLERAISVLTAVLEMQRGGASS